MSSTNDTLIIERLNAGYRGRPVLRDLQLPIVKSGQLVALVGPNGAGKSTLLRSLAGLIKATGSAQLGDLQLIAADPSVRARRVAFMPQSIPDRVGLTVLEAVLAALRASPLDETFGANLDIERHAIDTLERVGITRLALEPLDKLSGGQRQLASLAQAIVRQPRLLLLDEPTSALDLRHQVVVMQLVRSLAAEGRIVIVVVHDLNLAARWADTVVVVHNGHAHSVGAPRDAISPAVLSEVYGVDARVEFCSIGRLQIIVDGLVNLPGPVTSRL